MSDTPETDAVAFAGDFDGQGDDEVVFANLARRFERERNKAEAGWLECRNFAQQMVDERDCYKSEVEVITRERDEALNKAHNYEQGYLTHAARADTLEKERDEAREAGWKVAMQAVWDRLPMPEYANDPMTPREVAKLIEFVRSQKEAAK